MPISLLSSVWGSLPLRPVEKNAVTYFFRTGMTSPGVPLNTFLFTVVLSIMITIIMLEDKARATLLQCSPTVITSMELTRYYYIF